LIFSKILGDIRKSRCTSSISCKFTAGVIDTVLVVATGVVDTGSKPVKAGVEWFQVVTGI
jgi:hypothetical protein